MPDKVVEVPGVGNVAFPDSMGDDQIAAQIRSTMAAQGKPAEADKGWFDSTVDAIGRFFSGANDTANPVSSKALAANEQLVRHPAATAKGMLAAQGDLASEAGKSFSQGDYLTGIRHALAYMIPVLGPAIDHAGDRAQSGDVAGGLGEAAGIAVPLALGARPSAPGKPIVPVSPTASKIYQRALGLRRDTPIADARALGNTGVREGLVINEAGAQKLNDLVQNLQQQTTQEIKAGARAGMTVDPNQAADYATREVLPKFNTVTQGSSTKAGARAIREFLDENGARPAQPGQPPQPTGLYDSAGNPIMRPGTSATPATPARPMPIDVAQAKKINTYREVEDEFGKLSGSEIETKKGIAHNLMQQIEQHLPEVGSLNARQADALELRPAFEKAVNKAANGTGNFRDLLVTEVASHATGRPGMGLVAGVMAKVLRDPALRSKLAIAINRAQQNDPARWGAPSMKSAIARVNAYADVLDQASGNAAPGNAGNP